MRGVRIDACVESWIINRRRCQNRSEICPKLIENATQINGKWNQNEVLRRLGRPLDTCLLKKCVASNSLGPLCSILGSISDPIFNRNSSEVVVLLVCGVDVF